MNENSGFLMDGTQEMPGPFRERGGHGLGKGFLPKSPTGPGWAAPVQLGERSRGQPCTGEVRARRPARPCPRRGAGLAAPRMTFTSPPACAVGVSTLPYSLASWALSD